ncbi:MAG: tetratricopeptide repeat protein [Treponema sp.]|jgi:hypothetical protein|nr:tetratricopeptide repeat protein [Treponema sp.]
MKPKQFAAVLVIAAGLVPGLSAQVKSAHYEIFAPEETGDASIEMEQRFQGYNRIFRFDPSLLAAPLRVRIFTQQEEYDSYVSLRLGNTRPGAVYLHYDNPAFRELVVHRGGEEEARLLPHQAFIQFLRAFVPQPPAWIREGFASYFNSLVFNRETETLEYTENLDWLDAAKNAPADPQEVLLADAENMPQDFQARAWSLVAFFAGAGDPGPEKPDYRRALTDAFMVLSPSASTEENTRAVYNRIKLAAGMDELKRDHDGYLDSKKSFIDLINEGQRAYGNKDFAAAAERFREAAKLKPGHYASYYYQGLLAYEDRNYAGAEEFYKTAMEKGGDRALIQYALGVNAVAAGKTGEAAALLEEAAADPGTYGKRAGELLKRLR